MVDQKKRIAQAVIKNRVEKKLAWLVKSLTTHSIPPDCKDTREWVSNEIQRLYLSEELISLANAFQNDGDTPPEESQNKLF